MHASCGLASLRGVPRGEVLGGVRSDFSSPPKTFSCANHCVFEIICMLAKYSVQGFKTQCGKLEIYWIKCLFTVNAVKQKG